MDAKPYGPLLGDNMKFIFAVLLVSMSSFSFAESIKVTVNGMVCSMCAQGIEKKFKKMDAVKEIKVDLDNKIVILETKDKQDIEDAVITKMITESGYNVSNIKRGANE